MKGRTRIALAFAPLLLLAPGPTLPADSAFRSVQETRRQEVSDASKEAYRKGLAWYDNELKQRPYDVVLAVDRCQFIEGLESEDDGLPWQDDLYKDEEKCMADLDLAFPDHPEVELAHLRQNYGQPLINQGEAILGGDLSTWTPSQLAQLHAELARAYQQLKKPASGRHALEALNNDAAADTRLIAAEWLISTGDRNRAIELLTSPLDDRDRDVSYAAKKMALLAQVKDREDVLKAYARLGDTRSWRPPGLIQSLLEINAVNEARRELDLAGRSATAQTRSARFLFEFDHGTAAQAFTAYEDMRSHDGLKSDPVMQYRFSLLSKSLTLPWRTRDLLGLAVFGSIILAAALIAIVPISFVHYRGLARQLHDTRPAEPMGEWHLREAWFGLFVFLVAGCLSLYFVGPIGSPIGWSWEQLNLPVRQLGSMLIVQELMFLALLVPFAVVARSRGFHWSERWGKSTSVLIGSGIAFLLRIPTLLLVLGFSGRALAVDKLPQVMQVLLSLQERYGLTVALLVGGVAAPVCEEFIFRGVMLGAFARKISFAASNVLQAAIFTAMHFSLDASPMLFILGLTAGALTKRSGGLLAAIALHATFNAIAIAAMTFLR